jgi:hypothetical protein
VTAPHLEPRRSEEFVALLRERLPGYVPGWQPPGGGPGDALLAIYARFLGVLGERIDRTPDKAQLAFLDMLGLELLPAQAARAPVVLETMPQLGDARAPARTRLGATPAGGGDPIVFETETGIGLAAARIAEVVTVWPGRDAFADHSADAVGGRPFTLWRPLRPIPHELYLAHDLHLALAGQASVQLDIELGTAGSEPLAIVWQHWDGELWRDFTAPDRGSDTTAGLTRSGAITLRTDCGRSEARTVGGFPSHWLRGSLAEPLTPAGTRTLPEVDRITMRTVLERDVGSSGGAGLPPDCAFAGGARLDTSKPFQPFGAAPSPDVAFYAACDEAFSRPGAEVTIGLSRAFTEQEKNDIRLARYEIGVNEAKARVDQLKAIAAALDAALTALLDPATGELRSDPLPLFDGTTLEDWYADVRRRCQDAYDALRAMAAPAQRAGGALAGMIAAILAWDASPPEPVSRGVSAAVIVIASHVPLAIAAVSEAMIIAGVGDALDALSSGDATLSLHITDLQATLTTIDADITTVNAGGAAAVAAAGRLLDPTRMTTLAQQWLTVANDLDDWPGSIFLSAALPQIFVTARQRYAEMRSRIDSARAKLETALGTAVNLEDLLEELTPKIAAAAAGLLPPKVKQPTLTWQYWNGTRWQSLQITSLDADGDVSVGPRNFRHGRGRIRFTAPADWRAQTLNDTDGRWLRVLIRTGAFAITKTVTWFDQESGSINYMPIFEPRPPLLDVFTIGYSWHSNAEPAQHCLTLNDFQWTDRSEDAAWRGTSFAPFSPTDDLVPTLYVGFDRPLPADLVGLYAEIAEVGGETAGPPLEWQAWDGVAWRRVLVEDETAALALPGALRVLWPGGDAPPAVAVVAAAAGDARVRVPDARAALAFARGDRLWIAKADGGELVTVAGVSGDTIALTAPLSGGHDRGTISQAGLARFGRPRTWLRARLRSDGDPREAVVSRLHLNAVWASQLQTVRDELLGSSNGEPRQSLRFTRAPVLRGEQIEVREIDGPRAAVEYPLLIEELARAGIAESDVRVVSNQRSGAITEIWVPWREQPNLLFSGPGDRHYAVERSRGRLLFGDGVNGRIPPAGANAVRAREYRSGGGDGGNLPAGAVAQVLSGVVVQNVSNPITTEGGANGEPEVAVLARGPLTLRNRRQALSADDYEALAREASPAVALSRALPAMRPGGLRAPGWVTVIIAPRSSAAEPQPSLELRRRVREFLLARTPAALAGRLAVVGPTYQNVGITAAVIPRSAGDAGAVVEAVRLALAGFLHPLTGGPDGAGWAGRHLVCVSDVAALVERIDGVDHADELRLVDRGVPTGDVLRVPADRIVVAGPITISLAGA